MLNFRSHLTEKSTYISQLLFQDCLLMSMELYLLLIIHNDDMYLIIHLLFYRVHKDRRGKEKEWAKMKR